MLIVDAHEDLAWNMLTYERDYTLPAAETRRREANTGIPEENGDTLLGWPEYQRGQVAVVFSTLFAAPIRRRVSQRDALVYADISQANKLYREQVDLYHRLVDDHPEHFRLILAQEDLEAVVTRWESNPYVEESEEERMEREAKRERAGSGEDTRSIEEEQEGPQGNPVGLVILMEGAEGVRAPAELDEWWERGVRLLGPAWAGNRFTGGTREPGPMTRDGYALLEAMAGLGFVLDISHMDEQAALQALDFYPGRIIASHANALRLLKGAETNRHLTDNVIRGLLERDGIIGVVPANSFLLPGWRRGDRRESVTLQHVAAQIDTICQMAGDSHHVGIGSDFDGGFGLQSVPAEIDTVADIRKIAPVLAELGYEQEDIAAIMGQNWLNLLRQTLPES